MWLALAGTATEVRGAAVLAAAAAAASIDRLRPSPLSDGKLLWLMLAIGAAALAVASLTGVALSQWAMTRPGDVLFAAGGAVVVGAVFLGLLYLVFASKDERSAEQENQH